METLTSKDKNLTLGLWKFHERVGHKDLMEITKEWAKDDNYELLYIRKVSKDQNGIGFAYKTDGSKKAYDKYFEETTDYLKRKFGNDLVGWDIGAQATLIKGFFTPRKGL